MSDKTYDIILADPPWSYTGAQDKWGAAAKFYDTMTDDDLLNFPMRSLMHDKSILFLWCTSPRLDFSIDCIRSYGLTYRGMAFVWVKTKKDGSPMGACGVRPSIVKSITEYVIAASPVKTGRPMKLSDESVVQTVFAPREAHSQKPIEVQEKIEKLYPNASRLELFARNKIPGWDAWGNEVECDIEIELS